MKTITSRCMIQVNAHAPIRDSAVFIGHYCVFENSVCEPERQNDFRDVKPF